MAAVRMPMLKSRDRCWLRRCGLGTVVSLAAVFNLELKLRVLFPKELSCVFCCNSAAKKLPVGLLNGGDCLVHNLYHSARLKARVSLETANKRFKLTVFPALLKSML
jgi:hypothetical protein